MKSVYLQRKAEESIVVSTGALGKVGEDLLPIAASVAAPGASRIDHMGLHVEDEFIAG